MKILISFIFLVFLNIISLEAYVTHLVSPIRKEWKEENLNPFNELMLTWNAARPREGKFLFYISVKTTEWSPWLLYALWGKEGQLSFLEYDKDASIRVYQDAVEIIKGQATAFQIKIIPQEGASLDDIHSLHVYTNEDKFEEIQTALPLNTIQLKFPGLSQMTLDHIRYKDLCSPTSAAAVVKYLANDHAIDPVNFAQKVWDAGFDIYGNWVFNVAQISSELGKGWHCWVERLSDFSKIYAHLLRGEPVVVSIRGPLPGSALPYAQGHLLVVTGYDALHKKVICMDPAFPTNNETHVAYDFEDFIRAWGRRENVAYVFSKQE